MLQKILAALLLLSTVLQQAMITPTSPLEKAVLELRIALLDIEEDPIIFTISQQLRTNKNCKFFSAKWQDAIVYRQSKRGVKRKELHP